MGIYSMAYVYFGLVFIISSSKFLPYLIAWFLIAFGALVRVFNIASLCGSLTDKILDYVKFLYAHKETTDDAEAKVTLLYYLENDKLPPMY